MIRELYEYQNRALQRLATHFKEHGKALLVMATGLGKTIVAAFWAKEQLQHGRGLVLCHDSNILKQAMRDFREVLDETVSMGIFYGGQKEYERVDILFATFQTFREWRVVFFENEFNFIIVDESHHSEAETYRPVIKFFKPEALLGMTATPDRMDGKDIREVYGDEVVYIGLEEAIANSWLTAVDYHMVTDNLNSSALGHMLRLARRGKRRVSLKQLNETIFIRKRDEEIAAMIMERNLKTIVFCENLVHADNFVSFLPNAATFHIGNTPTQNDIILSAFRTGEIQYILAVNKFNEGIDIPDAEQVVFLRCTDSRTIFLQQLGRGLRKAPGKNKVVVLDFVANCERVTMVQQMVDEVAKHAGLGVELDKRRINLSGDAFNFVFTDEVRDIIEVVRLLQRKLFISEVPHLLAEYMRDRNPMPPELVQAGTGKKLWWKCSKCGYEWEATGNHRTAHGRGCPACAGKAVTPHNCMATTHPSLAAELHPTKNSPWHALNLTAGTNRRLTWCCSTCRHEWKATGAQRARHPGCPSCTKRVVTPHNCMATTHSNLAAEFDVDKNSPLTPSTVIAGSERRLWWKCSVCGHSWQASANNRSNQSNPSGCPTCARKRSVAGAAAARKKKKTI